MALKALLKEKLSGPSELRWFQCLELGCQAHTPIWSSLTEASLAVLQRMWVPLGASCQVSRAASRSSQNSFGHIINKKMRT